MTDQCSGTCQLPVIPAAALKAVLPYLTPSDYASIRQVNRCFKKHITQHVPYITLLLSDNSNVDPLLLWSYFTQQFQHVCGVHIHISGELPVLVFDSAMHLLSERSTKVTELHLLSVDADSSSSSNLRREDGSVALVTSLLPLKHVLDSLKILTIEGIAVENMIDCLRGLAATATEAEQAEKAEQARAEAAGMGGWQLQQLTLNVQWNHPKQRQLWPAVYIGLDPLLSAFPRLKQLTLQCPDVEFDPQLQDEKQLWPSPKMYKHPQLSKVAVVAAVTNAVMDLEGLEVLTLTDLPDLWGVTNADNQSAIMATVAAGAKNDIIKEMDKVIGEGPLTSIAAAATALSTLDDLGCWLLQQHQTLRELRIQTAWPFRVSSWAMSWQQEQRQREDTARSGTATADQTPGKPVLSSTEANCRKKRSEIMKLIVENMSATDAGTAFKKKSLLKRCSRYLAAYSSRPLPELLSHITSFKIDVFHLDVHTLGKLLKEMKVLKRLEVTLSRHSVGVRHGDVSKPITPTTTAATQMMAAVAAVKGLESLTLIFEVGDRNALPNDLLLPLTTAAGGPGNSLKKIQIIVDVPSATRDVAHRDQICDIEINPNTFQSLKHLYGLIEAELHFTIDLRIVPDQRFHFDLASLPSNLVVFKAVGLNLVGDSRVDACASSRNSSASRISPTTLWQPLLRRLDLYCCKFDNISILAGYKLRELGITSSSWSGSWAAIAATCPDLNRLLLQVDAPKLAGSFNHSSPDETMLSLGGLWLSNTTTASRKAACAMTGICSGLRHLRSLKLTGLPMLSAASLQPVIQHMDHLQHVDLQCSSSIQCHDSSADCTLRRVQKWLQKELPGAHVQITTMAAVSHHFDQGGGTIR